LLLMVLIQLVVAVIIGYYFLSLLKAQQQNKIALERESKKELAKLEKLRRIKLSVPLSERMRPESLEEIVGQEDGIKALKAALCGPNPQHVIIYGPPGVGKTAAARLVLEEAKKNPFSPFSEHSKFVEVDATTMRFDERGIADPLIGSVHDPIYQGAGIFGIAGVPQPKPGAVTKAHGGILFIDEIGELHPVQMNKLLKVLEDRKVFLESAYYSSENPNIPEHIHDIFQKGLPADFRLIGATTRSPNEIPQALRSRCMEIYFRPLTQKDILKIIKNAVKKGIFEIEEGGAELIARYVTNGRDAMNVLQMASSYAISEGRSKITLKDIERVINVSNLGGRHDKTIKKKPMVGKVNGVAVSGPNMGSVIDIEAVALKGSGRITITGLINEEEIGGQGKTYRRKGSAYSSVENVLTAIRNRLNVDVSGYDIHINCPGGIPLDGPSAGAAIAVAVYSSIFNIPVCGDVVITGEVSIYGDIKLVGGVKTKIEAAINAGARKIIIPKENYQENFGDMGIEIVPVENLREVLEHALYKGEGFNSSYVNVMAASGIYNNEFSR